MAARSEWEKIKTDRALREAARLATADIRRFVKWGKTGLHLVESDQLSADDAAAIASIQETVSSQGRRLSVRLHDKNAALATLLRYLERDWLAPENAETFIKNVIAVMRKHLTPEQLATVMLELHELAREQVQREDKEGRD